ncbi:MAG: hypothetical protein QW478_14950 [Candidatus Micrarchaeaceae archaeon]
MRPYPSIWKELAVSGLFSLNAFVWSETIAGVFVAVLFGIIIFIVIIWLIRHSIKDVGEREKDVFAVIGINVMKEHIGTDEVKGIRPERVMGFLRKIDISLYISGKANYNMAVVGTAGSGKTELTYFLIRHLVRIKDGEEVKLKKIIFQYKNSDRYKELGFATIMLKNCAPNVFQDADSFAQAWICAFPLENIGITAGKIPVLVKEIAEKSSNFREFQMEIEDRIRRTKDNITISALQDIKDKLNLIYTDSIADFDIPDEVVLDFEGLNSNAFVFYAEYILRQLHREILNGKRAETILMIDEASLFNRAGNTIIPEIAKLIRSRGALMVATQSLADIKGDILNNCDTQFVSVQGGEDNLREVRAITELHHFSVTQLERYEFIDLRQRDGARGLFIFKLFNPSQEFYPVNIIRTTTTAKEETQEMNIKADVEEMLMVEAMNIQKIGKGLAMKYRSRAAREDINYFKLKIQPILNELVREGKVGSAYTEGVRVIGKNIVEVKERVYYWMENKGSYHQYLLNEIEGILKYFELKNEVLPQGKGTADVESDDFVIEVETGLKHSQNDLNERREFYTRQGKIVVVIIPNKEMKTRYADGKTPQEFKQWIEKLKGIAKEEVKNGIREES